MRVFMTGASGHVGRHVGAELRRAGHSVLALVRSDDAARAATAMGATAHLGSLEELDSLRRGAVEADAVIHLAFGTDFSRFREISEGDRLAVEALGMALAGSGKPLVVTNGMAGLKPRGGVATEADGIPDQYPFPRVTEQVALGFVPEGVRACVVRLAQVHDRTKLGLVTRLVAVARERGASAYVGEGLNRFSAVHVDDVAQLYRRVLEVGRAGARYHAVGEEGVPLRAIAEAIGRGLGVPVRSLGQAEAQAHFGPMAAFVGQDIIGSSAVTRDELDWRPAGPGLLADLEQVDFAAT